MSRVVRSASDKLGWIETQDPVRPAWFLTPTERCGHLCDYNIHDCCVCRADEECSPCEPCAHRAEWLKGVTR